MSAGRKWPAVVALVLACTAGAWGYWTWRAARLPERLEVVQDRRSLPPVPLPDVSQLDPSLQQQVRQEHVALTRILSSPQTTSSQLADAFGRTGRLFFATEHLREAEIAFLNAQSLSPNDMRWSYYLGHIYRARQEPPRAIAMFERVLTLTPDDVPTLIWLGELHLANGDAVSAEKYLQRAVARQPDSAAAVSRLGRAALARRDYRLAITHLERALQLNPNAASVHYPLGLAYRGAGELAKAEAHLQRSGDTGGIAPADPLMEALSAPLQNAGAFEARGMGALEERNWPAAVENLRKAVALAPGNALMRLNLGTALSLNGDVDAARIELLEAVRLAPDLAKAHFGLGLLSQDAGRHADAIERFTLAIRHDSNFVDAHFALAETLRRSPQVERSLEHYSTVMRLNPAAGQARFGYAMALVRLRRYDEARSALEEAVRIHPEQPGFVHALARILAAAPTASVRDGGRALTVMEPLVKQESGPAISETMGMVMAEMGRFAEASAWQERAIEEARRAGQSALAARLQDNLTRYRDRQPCRTPWRDDDPVIAINPR